MPMMETPKEQTTMNACSICERVISLQKMEAGDYYLCSDKGITKGCSVLVAIVFLPVVVGELRWKGLSRRPF